MTSVLARTTVWPRAVENIGACDLRVVVRMADTAEWNRWYRPSGVGWEVRSAIPQP